MSSSGGEVSSTGLPDLERRLGVSFEDRRLLARALRHRSAANEQGRNNNERLEFLGDAVLGVATATWLLTRFPDQPEGLLARHKSFLVSRESLHHWALSLDLQRLLELGVGEERSGGRAKPALLADAFEAVLGALFIESGLQAVTGVMAPLLEERLAAEPELAHQDVKSTLQETLHLQGEPEPEYVLVGESGPAHAPRFTFVCRTCGGLEGRAEGPSKKQAQQAAALQVLRQLQVAAGGS